MKSIDLKITSKTENVEQVLKSLEVFCNENNIDNKTIEAIQVATDEAITNIILHGYDKRDDGIINIKFILENNKLLIKIIDYAKSFQPEKLIKQNIDDVKALTRVGGFGLILMNALMDYIDYSYNEDEQANYLIMEKYLK